MRIGIVGHAADKFTPTTQYHARPTEAAGVSRQGGRRRRNRNRHYK